jgi:23S rRNA (guanosine2251-2'-O)-methyltransferase
MEGKNYFDESMPERSAFIFGNEGQGVRRLIKESSDEIISIPMRREVDSLNVAASAAVLLFEYSRQMYKKS